MIFAEHLNGLYRIRLHFERRTSSFISIKASYCGIITS